VARGTRILHRRETCKVSTITETLHLTNYAGTQIPTTRFDRGCAPRPPRNLPSPWWGGSIGRTSLPDQWRGGRLRLALTHLMRRPGVRPNGYARSNVLAGRLKARLCAARYSLAVRE
jgi:hypothetical protein